MSRATAIVGCLICSVLGATVPARAGEITLATGGGVVDLTPFARYALNDMAPLEAAGAAAALPEDAFAPAEDSALAFGFTDRVLWLTYRFHNSSAERGVWVLDLGRPTGALVVYEERASGTQVLLRESPSVRFRDRRLPHRNLLAKLELDPGERSRVLIGYRSSGTTSLAASIAAPTAFAEWNRADSVLNAGFYAPMSFLLLLGLAQAALLRSRVQLHYAAYVGAATLYVAQMDGIAFQFLWPDQPGWNAFAALPLAVAFGVASAAFARAFLRTRDHAALLDGTLLAAMGIGIAWIAVATLVDSVWLKRLGLGLAIAMSALWLIGAMVTWWRGRRSVRFCVVGAAAMFVATALAAGAHLALLPIGVNESLDVLKAGILFDALMFATAMADSTREVRARRDAAVKDSLASVAAQELASERLHAARKARIEAQLVAEQHGRALVSTSHSVEEPIAALRAAITGLAREGRVGTAAVSRLAHSVDYLDRLARGYSRGAASVTGGPFRIGTLLATLESLFRDAALAKRLMLRCRDCSLDVRGDATGTLRIVSNLVENAIKYTPAGKVLVGCRRRGQNALRIVVADTGPGMSDAELAVALAPYRRGAASADVKGVGLGLSIAARLAADLGYEFTVRTSKGRGSVFEVVVPRACPTVG